jgi:hypothetical protein
MADNMPEKVFRCQFVVSGPALGADPAPRQAGYYISPEAARRGVLTVHVDAGSFTQDLDEAIKRSYTIQASSAAAIRWYALEEVGLTEGGPAWDEMERQLHRVHDPEE